MELIEQLIGQDREEGTGVQKITDGLDEELEETAAPAGKGGREAPEDPWEKLAASLQSLEELSCPRWSGPSGRWRQNGGKHLSRRR